MGVKKIESAQKIHASRGIFEMHANQFWWAFFVFGDFATFQFWPKFPF